jgi:hypothetical protein
MRCQFVGSTIPMPNKAVTRDDTDQASDAVLSMKLMHAPPALFHRRTIARAQSAERLNARSKTAAATPAPPIAMTASRFSSNL